MNTIQTFTFVITHKDGSVVDTMNSLTIDGCLHFTRKYQQLGYTTYYYPNN